MSKKPQIALKSIMAAIDKKDKNAPAVKSAVPGGKAQINKLEAI